MTLSDELREVNRVFIDTAPIIYFIEAHPQFGPIAKELVDSFHSGRVSAYTSVVTLTEVLSKPLEKLILINSVTCMKSCSVSS